MQANTHTILRYAFIVSLGGFLFGYDAAVISGVIGYISSEFSLNAWQVGFVVAAPSMLAIPGIFAGPISDRIGRKPILLIISALYVASALCSAFAPNYLVLVLARGLGGFAFASLALAPIYITEIAPSEKRGRLVSINQLNIVIGFSAAYFGNDFFQKAAASEAAWVIWLGLDQHTWRWMLGAELIPALAYFFLLLGIPESPRWLALNDKRAKAKIVLAQLVSPADAAKQLQEICAVIHNKPAPFFKRLRQTLGPKTRFALIIGIIIAVAQQVSGINAVYFYAPTIFEQSGVGTNAAFTQAVWIGIINVVFTLLAIMLIDKLGRKPLLIGGLLGVFVSMSICSWGFKQAYYQLDSEDIQQFSETQQSQLQALVGIRYNTDVEFKTAVKAQLNEQDFIEQQSAILAGATHMNSTLLLFGVLAFVASFAVSLGPVMWVMLPEIFSNELRGVAMALTGIFNTSTSWLVQFIFPWQLASLGATNTFGIFALLALINLVIVIAIFPETKGRTVEELGEGIQVKHDKKTLT